MVFGFKKFKNHCEKYQEKMLIKRENKRLLISFAYYLYENYKDYKPERIFSVEFRNVFIYLQILFKYGYLQYQKTYHDSYTNYNKIYIVIIRIKKINNIIHFF